MSLYNLLLAVFFVALVISLLNKSIPSLIRIALAVIVAGLIFRLIFTIL